MEEPDSKIISDIQEALKPIADHYARQKRIKDLAEELEPAYRKATRIACIILVLSLALVLYLTRRHMHF